MTSLIKIGTLTGVPIFCFFVFDEGMVLLNRGYPVSVLIISQNMLKQAKIRLF